VGGDSGQVHAAGAVLDDEQRVQAAQEDSIDVEPEFYQTKHLQ
jgi:hypothetical protein